MWGIVSDNGNMDKPFLNEGNKDEAKQCNALLSGLLLETPHPMSTCIVLSTLPTGSVVFLAPALISVRRDALSYCVTVSWQQGINRRHLNAAVLRPAPLRVAYLMQKTQN